MTPEPLKLVQVAAVESGECLRHGGQMTPEPLKLIRGLRRPRRRGRHGGQVTPEPLKPSPGHPHRPRRLRHGGRMIPAPLPYERHKQAVSSRCRIWPLCSSTTCAGGTSTHGEVCTVVDQAMHPATIRVELRPEASDVPLVACSTRLRVVSEQGIGNEIGRLKGSGGAGIGEQWYISKVP